MADLAVIEGVKTTPVADVVKAWRQAQGLTLRAFAEALNEGLRNTGVSFQAVGAWEKGRNEPDTDFLLMCMVVYGDWRSKFALACLRAKMPEFWADGQRELVGLED